MNLVAELFGTPEEVLPKSYRAFRRYFEAQLAGDTITVTQPARQVAAVILASPLPLPLRAMVPAHRLATARILPDRLRREYGLRWTGLHELALPFAGRVVRYGAVPVLTVASRLQPARELIAA
jgi:uncharacterized protein (DUF2236 family)